MTARVVDTLLDGSVVGGYTRIGYRIRRRGWGDQGLPRMDGTVVLVTGATSGIGLAASEGFARLGASVRLLARSEERGQRARADTMQRTGNADVQVVACDLADPASIRRCAESAPRYDVLVNNASTLERQRRLTPDGVELTFATNVLGTFLLTAALQPAPAARIVNVSSGGMYTQRLDVALLESGDEPFDGSVAYARSKRAQVVLSEQWAQRLADRGVVVHAMHPGWVATPGLRHAYPRFSAGAKRLLRTPEQGADTILWLGASAEAAGSTGGFWHDRRRRPTHLVPWTRESPAERQHLWDECERLTAASA